MVYMEKEVSITYNDLEFSGFYTAPEGGNHPAILLIHEVWGMTDHIKDVARRFAKEGYVVLAPDLLSHTGITEKVDQTILAKVHSPETRAEAQKQLRAAMAPIQSPGFGKDTIGRLKACIDYLEKDDNVTERIAVVGFCFGGTYAYALATADNRPSAIVPFYGHAPEPLSDIAKIACPILAFYGEKDENLIGPLPDLEKAMDKHEKDFEEVIYPHTGHAFFNDTNPATYNADAASDAWAKTLTFLEKKS